MRALPGVESVTLSRAHPARLHRRQLQRRQRGGVRNGRTTNRLAWASTTSGPTTRATLQMTIVEGRDISVDDVFGRPRVALVSESMARRSLEGPQTPSAAGSCSASQRRAPRTAWITVVGVDQDIKQRTLHRTVAALRVHPRPAVVCSPRRCSTCARPPDSTPSAADLQHVMREIDPRVPFYNVSLLADHTQAATFQQKLAGDLLVVFGALALLLAGVGSYGVLSYLVGLRRREIGIRLAVGATRADVFRLIAGSGARLIAVGS